MKPLPYLAASLALLAFQSARAQSFVNGDFEQGNTGFTTDYEFATSNTTEAQYSVRSDPQGWNAAFAQFGDHTSGTGQMLVVNGAISGDPALWRQSIVLEAGTSYRFRAWAATAVSGGPASFIVRINGNQVGPAFGLPDASGTWVWPGPCLRTSISESSAGRFSLFGLIWQWWISGPVSCSTGCRAAARDCSDAASPPASRSLPSC